MKKKRVPDKSDLEAIRDQILDFACAKHDFKPETDVFLQNGNWNGVFIVKFKDNPEEERLYCEAPLGEHFIRFGMDLEVDGEVWQKEYACNAKIRKLVYLVCYRPSLQYKIEGYAVWI